MRRIDFILITLIIITTILSINTIGGTLFLEDEDEDYGSASYSYAYVSGYSDTEYPYTVYNVHHAYDYGVYIPPGYWKNSINVYPSEGGTASHAYTDVKIYILNGGWVLDSHAHAEIWP